MRHRKAGKTLSRTKPAREALIRDLVSNLILAEKIRTTKAKAQALRPKVERLVTVARQGTVTARRRCQEFLRTEHATKKLIEVIAPRYQGRAGGYTRTVRIGRRNGDGAEMVLIAFV